MRIFSRIAILLSVSFFLAFPTLAENVTVPAGRSSPIGGMILFNKLDCSYLAKPKVTISTPPQHGSVRVEWSRVKMTKARSPTKCIGKTFQGMVVIYTPYKGYHGPDAVKIGLSSVYHGTSSYYHAFKFDITVR
jgi:hypothetical protein